LRIALFLLALVLAAGCRLFLMDVYFCVRENILLTNDFLY